ncbi:radical SAM protein [Aquimarina sp. RZ0]|uniref:SPL family radical SAM protein n=1 Tax=Aquimarina sp. RZ0 TaxID=2607730 RepID=UPI0011F25CCF|nr:radical SAM protein [Aquimarina sp. RZ0]KAA1245575.1 radical SAM protein [Aquimarina sp. RZ0]
MAKKIEVKSILNKTKKRDPWFLDDYTINLYSSCSFNCLYCYIRGSKYGTNLEDSVSVKTNGIEILDRQLFTRARKNQYGIIVLSSATDPYLQIEKKYKLTREALKVIAKHKFPVHILTKSDLIERDFDLLHQINKNSILPIDLQSRLDNRGVIISFSFSTLDDKVARIFEKGATKPSIRLQAVHKAVQEKFHTGISLMPLLPFISDTTEQLDLFFSTYKAHKVQYILPATLTLFGNGIADSKTLMMDAIRKHYPELEQRYVKYFKNGSQMPAYYKIAFTKKMKELSLTYGIKDYI